MHIFIFPSKIWAEQCALYTWKYGKSWSCLEPRHLPLSRAVSTCLLTGRMRSCPEKACIPSFFCCGRYPELAWPPPAQSLAGNQPTVPSAPRATSSHRGVRQVWFSSGLPAREPQSRSWLCWQQRQPQLQLPGQSRWAGPDHGWPHLLRLADLTGDAVSGRDEGVCCPSLHPYCLWWAWVLEVPVIIFLTACSSGLSSQKCLSSRRAEDEDFGFWPVPGCVWRGLLCKKEQGTRFQVLGCACLNPRMGGDSSHSAHRGRALKIPGEYQVDF